jgi:hypothetical protein
MAKEPFKDPFPNLHRPSLFAPKKDAASVKQTSTSVEVSRSISINDVVEKMAGAVSRGAEMGVSESLKPPKAKKSSAEKPSRGRPKSGKPRPWEGSGLSKSEYYRRQKAAKEDKRS